MIFSYFGRFCVSIVPPSECAHCSTNFWVLRKHDSICSALYSTVPSHTHTHTHTHTRLTLRVPCVLSNCVKKTNKLHFFSYIYSIISISTLHVSKIVSFIIRSFRCLLYSQLCTKSCKRVQLLWFSGCDTVWLLISHTTASYFVTAGRVE